MRFAISNIAWDASFDEEMYLYLKQLNITGLEIAPTRIFPNNPYEHIEQARYYSRKLFEYFGLHVVSMQSIWYGRKESIFSDEEQRIALLEYTKKAFEFASAIGCPNLVFGCPKNRNISSEEDITIAINFFRALGKKADEFGTKLSLEANPQIYGTNFLNTTKETVELIKLIDSNGISLNYDFGTVVQNSEEIDEVKKYIPYINHVHISSPGLNEIVFGIEHDRLLSYLDDAGYDKYVSLEMKNLKNINVVKEKLNELKERENTNAMSR